MTSEDILERLGLTAAALSGGSLSVRSPIDGAEIARLQETPAADMPAIIETAHKAFLAWREIPAPRRGELVRLLAEELRASKEALGALVTLEVGKIVSEGLGEVQEMIDICDFAVGLSRQLHGLVIASERPGHRMAETWHPMGPCAIISAFNFPVAVWSWNAALALVCGDPVIWKPSEKTPLSALATMKIFARALERFGPDAPARPGADRHRRCGDRRSARFLQARADRLGHRLDPHGLGRRAEGRRAVRPADPRARRQQCDGRRPLGRSRHGGAGDRLLRRRHGGTALHLAQAPDRPSLDPRRSHPSPGQDLCEPADRRSAQGGNAGRPADRPSRARQDGRPRSSARKDEGGKVHGGGAVAKGVPNGGAYVEPAIVEMPDQSGIVREETFAPILYTLGYDGLDEAIAIHNDVPQGLSSSIFTLNLREAETFLSATGSDCGIANVNIGPSGAEIGGAFGGEKETGGGRESGSDAWKAYMRRQTSTVNYSARLPLAQGVRFDF